MFTASPKMSSFSNTTSPWWDRRVTRALRRGRRVSSLQLQSGVDLSRRLRCAVYRFCAGSLVSAGYSESDDSGSDRRTDSRVWFSCRRYGNDDGATRGEPQTHLQRRQRTHSSHAARAWLVATARGARFVWSLCAVWTRRPHLSRDRIETDRVHAVRNFGGGDHRGGSPSLSRSRRDSRRRETHGCRSPATSGEQHPRSARGACAFESFRFK